MAEFQPRYKLFQDFIGHRNHFSYEYINFIASMKRKYMKSLNKPEDFPIINQDDFTQFISNEVAKSKGQLL